jgi:hypothetical protein
MADEPNKEHPEDIESILSDLDAILTDMGGVTPALPEAMEPPKPVELPKPVAPPQPVASAPPVVPPPPVAPPKPIVPVVELNASSIIELSPREGMIKPAEKKPEPPKPAAKLPELRSIELSAGPEMPVEMPKAPAPKPVDPPKAAVVVPVVPPAPKPVEPPKAAVVVPVVPPAPKPVEPPKAAVVVPVVPPAPTAVPAPGPVVASTPIEPLPADAPKEQIRRVAYIYTASCSEVKTACAVFLSQAARTISKKPIFLREVLAHEVTAASDPNAVLQKALQVKASAILAIVEDWPTAKIDELSEACSRANLLFRAVAPADAQKKSTAVDIIVDMMLLPGEG